MNAADILTSLSVLLMLASLMLVLPHIMHRHTWRLLYVMTVLSWLAYILLLISGGVRSAMPLLPF